MDVMDMSGARRVNRNPFNYEESFRDKSLLKATSTKVLPGGKINIILYWRPVNGIVGYNLYRRNIADKEMPDQPLNGNKPIISVKHKETLESVFPSTT